MPGGPRALGSPPVVRTEAVLLRRTDYGESDRVVSMLTEARGKVSLLARSARSSRRRFGAALEPFQVVEVAFTEGRGELGTLREARVSRAFPQIASDLGRMTVAGEAIEQLRARLPDHHPEPRALFALEVLFQLLEDGSPTESALVRFELRALAVLGQAPQLRACVACGKALAAGKAALFSGARGGVVCRDCGGGPLTLAGATVAAMRASTTSDWADVELAGATLAEAHDALEAFVAHHAARPAGAP